MISGLVYLDSSAIVKLILRESETRALLSYMRSHPSRVTSVVSTVEVPRAVRRVAESAAVNRRLQGIVERLDVVDLDDRICRRAAALEPLALRAIDAVHVATALGLGGDLGDFVTYDNRQADAARTAGLTVVAPRRRAD